MIEGTDDNCQICGSPERSDIAYVVDGYPVLRCKSCGVGRVAVKGFDPSKYYDDGYFTGKYEHSYTDYIGSKSVLSREFTKTLQFVRAHGPQDGRLLEVGCAYGLFLQQARCHYEVYGVEPVGAAASYCHAEGLAGVKHGFLTEQDFIKIGAIDVAVMLDVIEHIDNVAETVELVAKHLRKGGSFVVTTGDWSSLVARLTGPRWRLMAPPLHLWYFTPHSLETLGRRFGLEVISCSHPWKIVPLELILHQASSMLGLKTKMEMPRSLKRLGLPANMHDAMRIVFRKMN